MITLTVIAYQRYKITMRPPGAPSLKYPDVTKAIAFIWVYSICWTVPPLFGWSSYQLEGPRIGCSVDWSSGTVNGISYIMAFFLSCLILPLGVIAVCYVRLWQHVHKRAGQQHNKKSVASKAEGRIGLMVVVLITCFLLCWLPYGLVALIVAFGKPQLITPTAAIVCTLMAKSSVMWNPVIYVVMNNQAPAGPAPLSAGRRDLRTNSGLILIGTARHVSPCHMFRTLPRPPNNQRSRTVADLVPDLHLTVFVGSSASVREAIFGYA
ncbi:hypothetical protein Bbelb_125550 [Branchiostoma belcheri]|nr:hypothetical protein Bbelb_125550 [Branchiostoma belcheri]